MTSTWWPRATSRKSGSLQHRRRTVIRPASVHQGGACLVRGLSSAGRALRWHCRGQRFEPVRLHQADGSFTRISGLQHELTDDAGDIRSSDGPPPGPELSVQGFLLAVWRRKWLLCLFTVVGLLLGAVYLRNATYRYTAEIRLTPAAQDSTGSGLAGLAGLAGANLSALPGLNGVSPLAVYAESLRGDAVMMSVVRDQDLLRHILSDQWNSRSQSWHPPQSIAARTGRTQKLWLGIPTRPWTTPGVYEVREYLDRHLNSYENPKTMITTVSVDDTEPTYVRRLLATISAAADNQLRSRALARSSQYIAYIQGKLPTITVARNSERFW